MKTILTFALFVLGVSAVSSQSDTCLVNSEIGISFPPVADELQRDFAKAHLDSLGIKRIRFGENWAFREPSDGVFNWTSLDQRITWANENEYEVLLTIQSQGPLWACGISNSQSCVFLDNNDFKNYIDSLLQRYPNQIDKIQFGNEWQSSFWYVGNAQQFIDANNILYNSVQAYSPSTKVVLGGFTTISLRYLAGCNGYVSEFYDDEGEFYDSDFLDANCSSPEILGVKNRIDSVLKYALYDIVDIHLYDDVEQWDEYYANFSDTITKPIIVSEFGGPNLNIEPYTDVYHAEKVYEYIKKLDSIGVSEIYYFKLVEGTANPAHAASGLIDDTTLVAKPAYIVVKTFTDCMHSGLINQTYSGITFFPNPAQNQVTVVFDSSIEMEMKLQIISPTGQLIQEVNGLTNKEFSFNTTHLDSGYYIIQALAKNEVVGKGKLIIQK